MTSTPRLISKPALAVEGALVLDQPFDRMVPNLLQMLGCIPFSVRPKMLCNVVAGTLGVLVLVGHHDNLALPCPARTPHTERGTRLDRNQMRSRFLYGCACQGPLLAARVAAVTVGLIGPRRCGGAQRFLGPRRESSRR